MIGFAPGVGLTEKPYGTVMFVSFSLHQIPIRNYTLAPYLSRLNATRILRIVFIPHLPHLGASGINPAHLRSRTLATHQTNTDKTNHA
jgi:hypothetical protein